jgi:hypothetical protein
MVAVVAVVLSGFSIIWQVLTQVRQWQTRVSLRFERDRDDLVVTVINRGSVPELVRYLAFERRLDFAESALASGQRRSLGLSGAFKDPARARQQQIVSERLEIDTGVVREFDAAEEVRPRGDLTWRIPITELVGRQWGRGCYARVRLASGREYRYPRSRLIQKFYGRLLENALGGISYDGGPASKPSE